MMIEETSINMMRPSMQWSDIQFDPPRKTLRQFAGLWLVFFGGMAIWQALVRGRTDWR